MSLHNWLYRIWGVCILGFYALYFVHLSADFPNGSRWSDWVKYTDEGWYLNAATRHFLLGHWYLAGDFNPAVALPVWPVLAAGLFHFTGVSIVAARALNVVLFGITLGATYLFARRHTSVPAALTIVSLAVTSPFLFAFGRLAIVEPVLLSLFSVTLLVADIAGRSPKQAMRYGSACLLGCVFVLMLLTKTTAVVLFPAVIYVFFRASRREKRPPYTALTIAMLVALAGYAAYWAVVVHFRLQVDYHYLFKANKFPQPSTWKRWIVDLRFCLEGLFETDRTLTIAGAVTFVISCCGRWRRLWTNPPFGAAWLTLWGNLFFVFWHNYQAPHYFLFVAIPLGVVVSLSGAQLLNHARPLRRACVIGFFLLVLMWNGWSVLKIVLNPHYTFISAAEGIAQYIDQHPNSTRLVLGESGDQVGLMAGLPSMTDDFGTVPLRDEMARVQPGWFASWNGVEAPVLEEIHTRFHLQRAAEFLVMDDPRRNRLVLYRLVPITDPESGVEILPVGLPMQHRPR